MATIHISQAEAERNLQALLARLDAETEIVIENGSRPVAILHAAPLPRLSLSERIALLPADTKAVMDEDFARDVEDAIEYYRQPVDSGRWD